MNYIKDLREKIGHMPIILCSCGCLIFNEKKEVLLQRRSDDNLWGNPGGLMELGESIYDTIIREVKEETNLEVKEENLEIFGIYSGEGQHHVYPNGDETYFVNIVFKTRISNGNIKKDFESNDLNFFAIDSLPENITGPFKDVKRDLMKDLDKSI